MPLIINLYFFKNYCGGGQMNSSKANIDNYLKNWNNVNFFIKS